MPEKTVEKVEEGTRRYMREAEDVAQNAFRIGNDMMTTTIKYSLDTFGTMIRRSLELTNQTQHSMDDMMTVYRRMYSDGMKDWMAYLTDINKIFVRPSK